MFPGGIVAGVSGVEDNEVEGNEADLAEGTWSVAGAVLDPGEMLGVILVEAELIVVVEHAGLGTVA